MTSRCTILRGIWRVLLPSLVLAVALAGSARAAAVPNAHGMEMRLAACASCHGKHGEGDMGQEGGIYPRLAGQPADYLYRQMQRFASEERTGIPTVVIMQRLLENLSPRYLRHIAEYYQAAEPPYPPPVAADPARLREGRDLVHQGLPQQRIAACTECHGADLQGQPPDTPALAGQYNRYLIIQFAHWAQGQRHDKLHERIAHTLSDEQIQAVSAYLASLRPASDDASQ